MTFWAEVISQNEALPVTVVLVPLAWFKKEMTLEVSASVSPKH